MRVSDIKVSTADDGCELQARITGGALGEPFVLWYRFPAHLTPLVAANYGNPLLVAPLLPAMKAGERLEVPAPVSAKLLRSISKLQRIYHSWDRTLSIVDLDAPLRTCDPPVGPEVALFFSCGVDAFYSLIAAGSHRLLEGKEASHLIVVYGADINVSGRKVHVYREVLTNTLTVAEHFAKRTINVATNVKDFLAATGISWGMGQGAALASVGLFLESMCESIRFSSGLTYARLAPSGIHPITDPLWSTESVSFTSSGCEATRLEKTKLISRHQIALDTLRVCWARERPEYNCGRCSKCLRTMIALHIAGAIGRCRTLPNAIDEDSLRRIPILHSYEEPEFFQELLQGLGSSAADVRIREALLHGLAKSRRYFERLAEAKRKIGERIPLFEPFILVDQDSIREELEAGRRVIPFLERKGEYYGKPAQDDIAIGELERLRAEGARYMVFWWADFWWLDYYVGLRRHLEDNYRRVVDAETVIIFELGSGASAPSSDS